jgi:hypothetical protein
MTKCRGGIYWMNSLSEKFAGKSQSQSQEEKTLQKVFANTGKRIRNLCRSRRLNQIHSGASGIWGNARKEK